MQLVGNINTADIEKIWAAFEKNAEYSTNVFDDGEYSIDIASLSGSNNPWIEMIVYYNGNELCSLIHEGERNNSIIGQWDFPDHDISLMLEHVDNMDLTIEDSIYTVKDIVWDRSECEGSSDPEKCHCILPSKVVIKANHEPTNEDIIDTLSDSYYHCILSVGGIER